MSKNPGTAEKEVKMWSAYGLAMNLGFMIVTPILVFGGGGVLLDKYFNSFPLFIFIGFTFSMIAALGIVYVKTKDIIIMGKPPKK
ncbi:MAG: AtpZ/AtpI family protein [Candidatus Gracilibacteria bacterium]|jgi:F0F1-type ATP synthase assembly protein I